MNQIKARGYTSADLLADTQIRQKLFVQSEYMKSPSRTMKTTKHNYTRTCDMQVDSDDSENDPLRDDVKPRDSTLQWRSRSKMLSQMSYLTHKMTPQYQKGMRLLDSVELKNLHIEQFQEPTNKQIVKLNRDERPINYNAKQSPIELNPEVWNLQELHQMEFYYYKVRCRGELSPMQFFIQMAGNFKVFVSCLNPKPTKFSCEQVFTMKGWKYKIDEHKYFQYDYIYLAFVSDTASLVKMKFHFGEQQQKKLEIRCKMATTASEILMSEINQVKKRRRQRLLQLRGGVIKDLVLENIKMVPGFTEEAQKSHRELKKQIQKVQLEEVQQKKKLIDQEEQQNKLLKQSTKELTKQLRQHQKAVDDKKQQKDSLCSNWLTFIVSSILAHRIHLRFQHKILAIKESRMMAFQVKRIMKKIMFRLQETKGLTIYDRVFFDCRLVLSVFAAQIYHKQETIHVEKILPILNQRAEIYRVKSQMVFCYNKLQRVKAKCKEFLLKIRNYKNTLAVIWQKYLIPSLKVHSKEVTMREWFLRMQDDKELYEIGLKLFTQLFIKHKFQDFAKDMFAYQQIVKSIKANKSIRRQMTLSKDPMQARNSLASMDISKIRAPRLFTLPNQDDVEEFIPKVYYMHQLSLEQPKKSTRAQTKRNIFKK